MDTAIHTPEAEERQIVQLGLERRALEKAALIVERLQGNPTYTQAWRLAARAIRRAKPD